ncbi:uncharacterized protein OCT59_025349 [Rhizophagus irregularis]|uniref:uncharacterized protein n=1 Tax=Rhizophagus irregularis TaxID=588596 RepID=UPI00332DA496|nr:hypothetical protein OCT59_025349 [Rhizophagus irregularis]
MSIKFFTKLSQNYIELLKDDEYYDITIEVGEDPNVKIFRAHMNVLCYRSPYLRRILASNKKKNNDNGLVHIKLPNISPEIFQIILEYIYGALISLIKRDDLQMKEIEVWEYVLKWGLAKNPILILDPETWSDDDFKTMKNTLGRCLPSIRFFSLSSREFSQKVRPYQKLFDQQLYEELLNSYLDPGSVSNDNILRPRNIKINEIKIINSQIIDSKIVDSNIISTVSKRIDKMTNNDENYKKSYLPYKFELLLRGSRDGFTPKRFHELCDGKPKTVTFIKVKGTEEIIGGYNPLIWETSHIWGVTKNSFIFSFKNRYVVISKVKNSNYALDYSTKCGPQFGSDLIINSYKDSNSNEYTNFNVSCCKKRHYEKRIRDTENNFSIEDYEIIFSDDY